MRPRRRQYAMAACGLLGVARVWGETYCMSNCSKPTTNHFCKVTEDVCAYPTGDAEAYKAVRSISVWRGASQGLPERDARVPCATLPDPQKATGGSAGPRSSTQSKRNILGHI